MVSDPSLSKHAVKRLNERFGVDESWLLNELGQGRFAWIKGAGNSGNAKNVRSGHLIYIPNKNEYCIVVMEDRSRHAITALTEDMALNSPWGKGLTQAAKLKAKRIALGEEVVNDVNFLRLYAEERGDLSVTVKARTVDYDWSPITGLTICKIYIEPEEIDVERNCCTLLSEHINEVSKSLNEKITAKEMRPYGELMVKTGGGKIAFISNNFKELSDLESADIARRYGDLT